MKYVTRLVNYITANCVYEVRHKDSNGVRNAGQEFSARKLKSSSEEKARRYRLAHVQREALKAREMVEDLRRQLFDGKMPPFPEDARAATKWIEEQANPVQTMHLRLEVAVPAAEAGITPLIYLRDLLNQHLPENCPIPEDLQAFPQLPDRCDFINNISFGQPAPLYTWAGSTGKRRWGLNAFRHRMGLYWDSSGRGRW